MLGLAGLVAVVACFFALARAVCRWAGEPRGSVAGVLALALAYALPVVTARPLDSFILASIIAAALALGLAQLIQRLEPAAMRPAPPSVPIARWALILSFVTLVLVVWATIGTRLWDETNAHFGLTRVIARGMVPPAHPLFPQEPFRYHYGFDVLAALPQAFLGLRTDHAIDVATIACWIALVGISRAVGAELGGARGANLAMVLIPLGSGVLQIFLFTDFYLLGPRWSAIPAAWGSSMPPPVISNFFQHPQGLGMSLAIGVALLWTGGADSPRTERRRAIVGALLLGLLSLGQIVFFGLSGIAAGMVVLSRLAATKKLGDAVVRTLLLLAALGIGVALGGFLAPGPRPDNVLTLGKTYFGAPPLDTLIRHLVIFGLPFIALPFGLARVTKSDLRVFVVVAALGGFLVPNVIGYERSWDIVKFFGVGGFFANVVLVDVLAAWLPRHVIALILALVVSGLSAFVWLLRMSIFNGILGIHPMQFGPPSAIAVATTEAIDAIVGPRERVLSTNIDLAMTGGFLTPGFRWQDFGESYMMDRKEAERLAKHLDHARHTLDAADLAALDVRYVALSAGDVEALTPEGRKILEDPARMEKVAVVEKNGEVRHVFRVKRP